MINRVALTVARCQPLHKGHCLIIHRMIEDFSTVIIGLGSANKSRDFVNPWTIEERMSMIRNVFGDRVKIVPLSDIGSEQHTDDWADYVLEKISKVNLPEPTDYFTGSIQDSLWYEGRFNRDHTREEMFRRTYQYVKGGAIPSDINPVLGYFTKNTVFRKLHDIKRNNNDIPSATELRGFLQLRNEGWKEWVPAVNHNLIEDTYLEEFKVKIK